MSPVYMGAVLLEQTDSANMAQLCKNYNFIQEESEDGFAVFTDGENAKIRFKVENRSGYNVPLIEYR